MSGNQEFDSVWQPYPIKDLGGGLNIDSAITLPNELSIANNFDLHKYGAMSSRGGYRKGNEIALRLGTEGHGISRIFEFNRSVAGSLESMILATYDNPYAETRLTKIISAESDNLSFSGFTDVGDGRGSAYPLVLIPGDRHCFETFCNRVFLSSIHDSFFTENGEDAYSNGVAAPSAPTASVEDSNMSTWTATSGWTYSPTTWKWTHTTGTTTLNNDKSILFVVGQIYHIVVNYTWAGAGSTLTITAGGATVATITDATASSVTYDFTASATTRMVITPTTGFTGSVDGVSIRQTAGGTIPTGDYKVAYTYLHSGNYEYETNGSAVAAQSIVLGDRLYIVTTGSTNPQIDKIRIYVSVAGGVVPYYQIEIANPAVTDPLTTTTTILSSLLTGVEIPFDNNIPPKAKWILKKANRLWYIHTDLSGGIGSSTVQWSSINDGHSVPAENFATFDPEDGDEIVACGEMLNYIVVFKRHSIHLLDIYEFTKLQITDEEGAVAHGSVAMVMGGRALIYLADDGIKLFDGINKPQSISEKKINLILSGNVDKTLVTEETMSFYHPEERRYSIILPAIESDYIWLNYFFDTGGWTTYRIKHPQAICMATDKDGHRVPLFSYKGETLPEGGIEGFIGQAGYSFGYIGPTIKPVTLASGTGGNIPSGVYQVAYSYIYGDNDELETVCSPVSEQTIVAGEKLYVEYIPKFGGVKLYISNVNGTVLYSRDSVIQTTPIIDWATSYDSAAGQILCQAVFLGKLYVGADNGNIYVFDGTTWALSYDSPFAKVTALCVFNGKLYAGYYGNNDAEAHYLNIDVTSNGIDWGIATRKLFDYWGTHVDSLVVHGDYLYVSVAHYQVLKTIDGSTWVFTNNNDGPGYVGLWENTCSYLVSFAGSLYRIFRSNDYNDGLYRIIRKYDEVTFAWSTVYTGASDRFTCGYVWNNKLYIGGTSGKIFESANGTDYTEVEDLGAGTVRAFIEYGAKLLAAYNDKIYETVDGATWTLLYDSAEAAIYSLILFGINLYAGTGSAGKVLVRTDDSYLNFPIMRVAALSTPSIVPSGVNVTNNTDDGDDIRCEFKTVPHNMGLDGVSKQVRRCYLEWQSERPVTGVFDIKVDFKDTSSVTKNVVHPGVLFAGGSNRTLSRIDLKGKGQSFEFDFSVESDILVTVYGMSFLWYPISYQGVVNG